MTNKELKRIEVMTILETGKISANQATELMGLSLRQTRRIIQKYRKGGAQSLAHGNRGKASPNRLDSELVASIQILLKERYMDYNTLHLVEVLEEKHGLKISASSLTRIRRQVGCPTPRRKKSKKYYARRERKPFQGQMLQADGSHHAWLEGRGPKLTLIAYIDDATNQVYAKFRETEDAAGYLEVLQEICLAKGIPQSIYMDKRLMSRKKAAMSEQLAGKDFQSQFERVLEGLGVELITAHTPQAKGRIERLFDTFQDRLVKALREAGADRLESSNRVLEKFLLKYNNRFMVKAQPDGSAFVPWPDQMDPYNFFVFQYTRTVKNDNTVPFDQHALQLPPGKQRHSYARANVSLCQHLDGILTIHYQGVEIARFEHKPGLPLKVGKFTPADQSPSISGQPVYKQTEQKKERSVKISSPDKNHPWKQNYGYHLNGKLIRS